MKHIHHIIPRHMGGTDSDLNKIEVTVEEHAELHRRLYMAFDCLEDKLAWKMLEGQAMLGENLAIKSKLGWEKANANGPVCKGRTWYHNPEDPKQQTMQFQCPEGWVKGRGKIKTPERSHCKGSEKQRASARKQGYVMGKKNQVEVTVKGLTFDSRVAAAEHFGVSRPTISNWMKKEAGA